MYCVAMSRNSVIGVSGVEVFGPFESEDAAETWLDGLLENISPEDEDDCNFSIQEMNPPSTTEIPSAEPYVDMTQDEIRQEREMELRMLHGDA